MDAGSNTDCVIDGIWYGLRSPGRESFIGRLAFSLGLDCSIRARQWWLFERLQFRVEGADAECRKFSARVANRQNVQFGGARGAPIAHRLYL